MKSDKKPAVVIEVDPGQESDHTATVQYFEDKEGNRYLAEGLYGAYCSKGLYWPFTPSNEPAEIIEASEEQTAS